MPKQEKPALSLEDALIKAKRYCAKSEHCQRELERKLYLWGLARAHWQTVIDELKRSNYLNHERYARAYTHDKHNYSAWGAQRIEHELRAKGIPQECINKAIAEVMDRASSKDQLHKLLSYRYRSLAKSSSSSKIYQQLVRFGLYRGYQLEDIKEALSDIIGSQEEAG